MLSYVIPSKKELSNLLYLNIGIQFLLPGFNIFFMVHEHEKNILNDFHHTVFFLRTRNITKEQTNRVTSDPVLMSYTVRTDPGNPGKYLNFSLAFSRTGKSLKMVGGFGKSWKSVNSSNKRHCRAAR